MEAKPFPKTSQVTFLHRTNPDDSNLIKTRLQSQIALVLLRGGKWNDKPQGCNSRWHVHWLQISKSHQSKTAALLTTNYTDITTDHVHLQSAGWTSPAFLRKFVESSWNVMAHGDVQEENWRGKWRMEWVDSTLHTISKHGVSSITTADAHNSAASSRLNWRPWRFKWTRPLRRKTKSAFCACVITFQTQSTVRHSVSCLLLDTAFGCFSNITFFCYMEEIFQEQSNTTI